MSDRKAELTKGQDVSHGQSQSLSFSSLPLTLHHELEDREFSFQAPGSAHVLRRGLKSSSFSVTCLPLRFEAATTR